MLLAVLTAFASGCAESEPDALDVNVSFVRGTRSSTRDATVRVDIHIVPSCDDLVPLGISAQTVLASTYVPKGGDQSPPSGSFESADSYGLYALGRNEECEVIAAGCDTIEADTEGPLDVSLREVEVFGPACPTGQQCIGDGECADSPCTGQNDRTPCMLDDRDGQCRSGSCCTGCWDGVRCQPGDESRNCGTSGERCDSVNFCR